MSKVYSFRLSEDNPREARARRIIEAWVKEGYSLRHIFVEALLDYKRENSTPNDYGYLVKQLQNMIDGTTKIKTVTDSESSLSNSFRAGILGSVKKGVQA
jgi:tRNA U34 5-carboxymethylaminomethyl modifying GTPase MnmE/TrmE